MNIRFVMDSFIPVQNRYLRKVYGWQIVSILLALFFTFLNAVAGEKLLLQLRDFTDTEVKSAGFTLPSEMKLHIQALGGGGEKSVTFTNTQMYAYGWIIDAGTREPVWIMDRDNTSRQKDDRSFDGVISLPKGSYEVYFAAYAFAGSSGFNVFNINIDRRKHDELNGIPKHKGFLSWLDKLFGNDFDKEWKRRSKKWGIDISVDDRSSPVSTYTPPKEFANILYQSVRMGENERIKQPFSISKQISVRIYALGEIDGSGNLADFGWITNTRNHKRVWEMNHNNLRHAGGADKNMKFDDVVTFAPGDYILYFGTDDSHSFVDWNSAPPSDPYNYGVTLIAERENEKTDFRLSSLMEHQNVIVDITRVGNNQTRSASFTLKTDARLHIYALGERSNMRHQMADYGWIINAKTREKVWTMDASSTDPAGGADKNRMADEIIDLPKGTYTVFYQTDDSHAYDSWNSSPPFDADHWGITISGEGENFDVKSVERNVTAKESGIISQIVRVGDNADLTEFFKLDKPMHVRIYALGEGQNKEMYDYGWIEDAKTGTVVWEMTYSMTFHAGGGRKNRLVNTPILLDKGEYKLRYKSDDSHSFTGWNTDPPDDPTMWGITIYEEK